MASEDSGSVREQERGPRRVCPGIWMVYAASAANREQTVLPAARQRLVWSMSTLNSMVSANEVEVRQRVVAHRSEELLPIKGWLRGGVGGRVGQIRVATDPVRRVAPQLFGVGVVGGGAATAGRDQDDAPGRRHDDVAACLRLDVLPFGLDRFCGWGPEFASGGGHQRRRRQGCIERRQIADLWGLLEVGVIFLSARALAHRLV
ncbi:hypothetical protein V8D89_009754 [Ganoderma adspersum]